MDRDDIAGVVQSASGPEAGVWVIAETGDLGTRFARIVVTDDDGRYLVPDLPDANYQLWVRGYGLKDSVKVAANPGDHVDLAASIAPDAATAAQAYPAAYWYSMLGLPTEEEVADIPGGMNNYLMWTKNMGCIGCHQIGQLSTRTLPEGYGVGETSEQAWARRIASGQAGDTMVRIAAQGLLGLPVERNVVATVRDWSSPQFYMHDLSGTDRRDPTVNAYGRIYGAPRSRIPRPSTRCRYATRIRRQPMRRPLSRRHRTGATNASGIANPTFTIRCSIRMDACG
jgi:hypothetical protein